jgi:hypothetical protein
VTLYIFYLCLRSNKLDPSTPRLVFTWFLYSHRVCIAVGATGYALFLLELLGAGPLVWLILGKGASILLLFYGLYFGVLGRDTAEVAASGLVCRMHDAGQLSMRTCFVTTQNRAQILLVGASSSAPTFLQLCPSGCLQLAPYRLRARLCSVASAVRDGCMFSAGACARMPSTGACICMASGACICMPTGAYTCMPCTSACMCSALSS